MSFTAKTWEDLLARITRYHALDGGAPDSDIYLDLANQALVEIAETTGIIDTSWAGADITVSGSTCTIPIDCIAITRVEIGGIKVDQASTTELNRSDPNWRTITGPPRCYTFEDGAIIFDGVPTGAVVLYGIGYLPEIILDADNAQVDPNPLELLPFGRQLLPADYVLMALPADPENPMEMTRVNRHTALWASGLTALSTIIASRKRRISR